MKTFEEYQKIISANSGDKLVTSYDEMLKTVMLVTAIDELTMAVRELHQSVQKPVERKSLGLAETAARAKDLSNMLDMLRASRNSAVIVDDYDTEE